MYRYYRLIYLTYILVSTFRQSKGCHDRKTYSSREIIIVTIVKLINSTVTYLKLFLHLILNFSTHIQNKSGIRR